MASKRSPDRESDAELSSKRPKIGSELQDLVSKWLEWDQNEETLAEVRSLLADANSDELEKRMSKRIAFGTAGLRGRMQAGFSSMNDLTVLQAAQGICAYLLEVDPHVKERGVVLGYDGRHHSRAFAELSASTFLSRGVPVYLFSRLAATPLVPFCVSLKGCSAGIMVTASHNPKDDNGYKVYWSNGAQIVEPHDRLISRSIAANLVPWRHDTVLAGHPLLHDPTADVEASYFEASRAQLSYHEASNSSSKTLITYTPMHGVGQYWAAKAFAAFKLPPFVTVPLQELPDPEFPTVAFPNPEEGKGALKLSMEAADGAGSSLVIANDPDADRMALAERRSDGSWKIFTGNEIGIVFAHWIWTNYRAKNPTSDVSKCLMLNSTVSSKMMQAMAAKEGFHYTETLTGFKWLGNVAQSMKAEGYQFLFAFEEAIGYMIGDICWDKDGVRGAAVMAELASHLRSEKNLSVIDYLSSLYDTYGYFASNNRYFFCYDPAVMERIFTLIRNSGDYCKSIGPFAIRDIRDLTTGYDSTQPDKKAVLPTSSSTHMITFYFENGAVMTLRGSGTEPKLKYYTELAGPSSKQDEVTNTLQQMVDAMVDQCLRPAEFGLLPPKDY